jgi:hypothetical protein
MKLADLIKARAGPGALPPNVSRRRFFGASAGAAGVVLGSGLWAPAHDDDDDGDDKGGRVGQQCPEADPIPHITIPPPAPCERVHFFFPGNVEGGPAPTDPTGPQPGGRDPSTVFNFDGVIGVADLDLTGTGRELDQNGEEGPPAPYGFHTDMRFMSGKFVATDGRVRRGAFVFI